MQIVVGLLVTTLLQIYRESFSEKKSMDRLRFEGDYGHTFVVPLFWSTLYIYVASSSSLFCDPL